MSINGVQARMARAAMQMTVRELAREAGLATFTLQRIEADLPTRDASRQALRSFLERHGICIFDHSREFGVRLSRGAACVRAVLAIHARAGEANADAAIRETLDACLEGRHPWKEAWRESERDLYRRDLIARLKAARLGADSRLDRTLEQAIRHVASLTDDQP